METYGIWGTNSLNGDREPSELFLDFGSTFLGREKPPLGRERPQNPGEISDTPHVQFV